MWKILTAVPMTTPILSYTEFKYFSSLSSQFILQSAEAKEYEKFKIYLSYLKRDNDLQKNFDTYIYRTIIEQYDLELIKILAQLGDEKVLSTIFERISNNTYCEPVATINSEVITSSRIKEFAKSALKIIIDKKNSFLCDELQDISYIFSKQEFEDFIQTKKINLDDKQYKELKLYNNDLEGLTPLYEITDQESVNITEALLTRTFSKDMPLEQIVQIYDILSNAKDETIKAVMSLTAASILDGSSNVRILFKTDAESFYCESMNLVMINANDIFGNSKVKATVIHELAHYFFGHLYKSCFLPINYPLLEGLKIGPNSMDTDAPHKITESHIFNHANTPLTSIALAHYSHIVAEKSFVNLAVKLLSCEEAVSEHFVKSDEIIKHAKFTCPEINLIRTIVPDANSGGSVLQLQNEESVSCTYDYDFELSHYYFFRKHENDNSTISICRDFTPEKVKDLVHSTLLPDFMEKWSPSNMELYIVQRVNDWINRGYEIFKINQVAREEERLAELLVRFPEFVAVGVSNDIMEQLQPMKDFWTIYVFPDVQKYMDEYYIKCSNPENDIVCLGKFSEETSQV